MKRRDFVGALGVSALLQHPESAAAAPQDTTTAKSRSRVDLNGTWERYVEGKFLDTVHVPSSLHPSGCYRLQRKFLIPKPDTNTRVMLHFDAVAYHGRVFLNGTELGTMFPYVPFEFDATQSLQDGNNTVEVLIADLIPEPSGAGATELSLGVNPGWEGYGGLIRDVYVEARPSTFVDNARLAYELNESFSHARCNVRVFVSAVRSENVEIEVAILDRNGRVAGGTKRAVVAKDSREIDIDFELEHPALWSPEQPHLYTMTAKLRSKSGTDSWSCKTGFRHIAARDRQFFLNGERLVLNGVCRHDMWKDQGFTLSRAQMEQDMRMIKGMGCNFVRLVHYPHHRHIVELAEELGLLVTEEPGYWQADFNTMPRPLVQLGLDILEKTIRRDWNSPAVFAWFLANESRVTTEYLTEGKAMCRRVDPIARLVSSANDKNSQKMRPIWEASGMDFFDQHPYTTDFDEFEKIADIFGDGKPLTFSEWGGKAIGQFEGYMRDTVDRFIDLVQRKKLAGHVFWSWQDLPQFTRIDSEMRDGILESGVVTETRQARGLVVTELERLFEQWRRPPAPRDVTLLPLSSPPWAPGSRIEPLNLQPFVDNAAGKQAWTDFEGKMSAFWEKAPEAEMGRDQWKRSGGSFAFWAAHELNISGNRFEAPAVDGRARPVVILPGSSVRVPVNRACRAIHFLGNVTAPGGFPMGAKAGEIAGRFRVIQASGEKEIRIRQGFEAARASLIYAATRIQPIAIQAQPVLTFMKDPAREHYQVLLFSAPVEGHVDSIVLEGVGKEALLMFGISIENA